MDNIDSIEDNIAVEDGKDATGRDRHRFLNFF